MRIHWYWPFSRPEEVSLAEHCAAEGDYLRIDVIDRDGAASHRTGERVEIMRSLPDVERSSLGGIRWIFSRAQTYWLRARQRTVTWRDGDFDLGHIHYLNRFTDIWFGRHRPEVLVISVHDVVPHQSRGPAAIERWILKRIYQGADALVVHHRSLQRSLIGQFDVQPDRVHVVGHQVFPVAPELRSDVPEHVVPTVLFFGSLRPNKGIPIIAQVIRKMPRDVNVRFQFAGHGDRELEELLLGLAEDDSRVDVEIGFASYERKAELFRQASVVVLPYTDFSSQSGVLHDAYGHGRPVVVTDVGALGETVREDGTGLVVPPSDPQELAAALVDVIANSEMTNAMRAAARRVSSERSPERMGRELRSLYTVLTKPRRTPQHGESKHGKTG